MSGPKVKICGITTVEDARSALEAGADLLGLNFYPPSPRAIGPERAMAIRDAIGDDGQLVGVFVNHPPAEMAELVETVGLDLVQFHGDEPWAWVEPFAERAIRALRFDRAPEASELEPWVGVWAWLFDTPSTRLWGGSGQSWDHGSVAEVARRHPSFVAGGIGPDNVREIVGAVPDLYGLDVCSGVESSPGVKDRALLRRLFEEIRHGKDSSAS